MLDYFGTSATHLLQIAGLILGITLACLLLVQLIRNKQTSPTIQCSDFIAQKFE
jgi:hypothetical protein